jgi:hypothetical protein
MKNQNDVHTHIKTERPPLFWLTSKSKSISLRCGAHARSTGQPCKAKAMLNGRCRNHGGMSTGAKTAEGRQALSLALKERMKGLQREKAMQGFRRWYESGGREQMSKAMAWRHWKRNPLWIHFGIIPAHLSDRP